MEKEMVIMAKDFFDELGENISKRAKDVSEKVSNAYETQRVRGKISNEEHAAEKLMTDIGRLVYTKFTEGQEVDSEFASICEEILSHEQAIEELKQSAAAKKGLKICPACKKEVSKKASFCPYCGTQVPDPEPEPEEAPAEEEEFDFTEAVVEEEAASEEETAEEAEAPKEETAEEETAEEETAEEETAEEAAPEEETAEEAEAPDEAAPEEETASEAAPEE